MADKTTFRWNYFTLEGICKAKCGLCDVHKRPIIHKPTFLFDHINDTTNEVHKRAVDDFKSSYLSGKFYLKDVDWDLYYDIVQSADDYMLNPKLECNSCHNVISIEGGTETRKVSFLNASPEMTSHLKNIHQVDEDNWIYLNNWIRDNTADYCNTTKSGAIIIYTCKKCDNESRAKNAIMFAKHMIDEHRHDEGKFGNNFSWDKIPKELLPLYSTVREDSTTLSSDIAGPSRIQVRPGPSRQGPSHQGSARQGIFSESTQFSSKRKKVLKKMSKPAVSTQIKKSSCKRRKSNSDDSE